MDESLEEGRTIPVIEEHLEIQKRQVVTGVVRVEKTVQTANALVNQELVRETVSVTHVPINQELAEPAVMRQEGDTTIIPVMEEILVVSKRLILKEEIRITRQREVSHHQEQVPLRTESVSIERREPGIAPGSTAVSVD
jgi:uncharacterized protein (TIGR02271 family)